MGVSTMIKLEINNWHRRMEKHEWSGHRKIKYFELETSRDTDQFALFSKEKLRSFGKNSIIPTTNTLSWWEREEET